MWMFRVQNNFRGGRTLSNEQLTLNFDVFILEKPEMSTTAKIKNNKTDQRSTAVKFGYRLWILSGIAPLLVALVSCFVYTITFDKERAIKSRPCGFLPILPLVTNVTQIFFPQTLFWKFGILLHFWFRVMVIFYIYSIFNAALNAAQRHRIFYSIAFKALIVLSMVELHALMFMVLPKEESLWHNIMVKIFGFSGLGYIVLQVSLSWQLRANLEKLMTHGRRSLICQTTMGAMFFAWGGIAFCSGQVNDRMCSQVADAMFLVAEYGLVIFNILFHTTTGFAFVNGCQFNIKMQI